MIGDVKMQTIKQRTGRSLTGDRPLFLALREVSPIWTHRPDILKIDNL